MSLLEEKRNETLTMKVRNIKTGFGNPRKIGKKEAEDLEESLDKYGDFGLFLIDEHDNVIAGNTILLSSVSAKDIPKVSLSRMNAYGYKDRENIIFLTDEIAPIEFSFYDWMEYDCGADFKTKVDTKDFDYEAGDATASGPSRQRSLFDICRITGMMKEPVLDFGCGKGAALAIMLAAGIKEVDGIEKSEKLSSIARTNMNKIDGEMVNVFHMDATEATDLLDGYNTFYLYDPFRGDTFRKVIDNIEDSVRRTKRHVRIIYANPWLHKEVEKNGIFRLTKQVDSEFFLNIVNKYENI